MKTKLFVITFLCGWILLACKESYSPPVLPAEVKYNTPSAGNPVLPGFFADPTIKKIGDTWYIYATTDGNGGGLGPSQVWVSKDFVNWTIMPMNWPTTYHIWAPDVMEKDGKYYFYYCEPCKIYCGVSETPRGPWENILGADTAVLIPDRFVHNAITLDAQHFIDDDGSIYLYWGTWGIYKGFGCGAGKLGDDLKTFTETRLIPNTEATDFFEAPFVIKKNGIYYFTYSSGSCHDHTYRVQYATSTEGPLGPFVFADNNPILETSPDSTIHGPGHHSILQEGDDYYIVYHRHNIPQSTRGMHRQIAVDKMIFTEDGRIEKVDAGHRGVGFLAENTNPFNNLALGKKITASSCYNEDFRPEYAVDDNNATLWRPKTTDREWIEIDLGKAENIERIWTQFEYATSYYQYLIEVSKDGKNWEVFSDKRYNTLSGSPMVDYGKAKARYVRLTFTGSEKQGMSGAIWNIKVFGGSKQDPPQQLVHLYGDNWIQGPGIWENNNGMLGGNMELRKGNVMPAHTDEAIHLLIEPGTEMVSGFTLPESVVKTNDYTLTYRYQVNGEWRSIVLPGQEDNSPVRINKKDRRLEIKSGDQSFILADVRLYNWQQEPAEIEFDRTHLIRPSGVANREKAGTIVQFSADDYEPGTVAYITNKGEIEGGFAAQDKPLRVEIKNGKKAFTFDGSQMYKSDFTLPASISDNAPYSMSAWVLNPVAAENEVIVDMISSYGELEEIMLCYGSDPRNGIICHYGWYEDIGLPDITGSEEWMHIKVTYDGHRERLYINGELVKDKEIYLRLPAGGHVTLGANVRRHWPFTGWLHSFEFTDTVE